MGAWQRIQELNRHVDLGAVFWAATAQTTAQGKITRADIGAKYLITEYLFTLRMGIVPSRFPPMGRMAREDGFFFSITVSSMLR